MRTLKFTQFSYSPLVWMLNSTVLNNEISKLHKKSLWIIYYHLSSNLWREISLSQNIGATSSL